MKKIRLHSEIVYIFAVIIMAFATALASAADFGVSMIVAPAYILSLKLDFITFGQAEYLLQLVLLIILCIVVRKFKLIYLGSFLTAVIYGLILDFFRAVIPFLNPDVMPPETIAIWARILMFISSSVLCSFSVAMFFKVYLMPEVYDLFPKLLVQKYHFKETQTKLIFDFSFLAISFVMTLLLFQEIKGIGIGTLIIACVNGFIIGFFSKMFDKFFDVKPIFPKFASYFELV